MLDPAENWNTNSPWQNVSNLQNENCLPQLSNRRDDRANASEHQPKMKFKNRNNKAMHTKRKWRSDFSEIKITRAISAR